MSEQFDALVIGAGIAGETCARRLNDAGMQVGLIEREQIGGECAYWAHFPSKTVFGPTTAVKHAEQLANVDSLAPGEAEDLVLGDSLWSTQDEEVEAEALQHAGITIIRGDARLLGPGQIRVAGRLLQTPHCILATGSTPRVPQIAGLDNITYWTSREVLSYKALPQQVVVVGGEAQAIELAEMLRHSSAEVTLITKVNRLMPHEDSGVGKHMAEHLYHYGVRVLLGSALRQITDNGNGDYIFTLDNEEFIHTQALVLAGSRTPRTEVLAGISGSVQVCFRYSETLPMPSPAIMKKLGQ